MAINRFGTADGVTVGSNVTLVARGTIDEVGINNSSSIGAGSSLVIDGTRHINGAKEAILVDADNNWTLSTSLGSLTDGPHSATLTIADNAGRRVSQTVSFTVVNAAEGVVLSADVETARTAVVFDLEHPFDTIADCRLIVEDRLGNTVLSEQNVSFPYTWTFAGDGVANPVADGHYTGYVLIKGTGQYGSSARIPIVIVK